LVACAAALGATLVNSAAGAVIQLKDGRQLEGAVVLLGGVTDNPFKNMAAPGDTRILMLDDQLRRTYVPRAQVAAINEAGGQKYEKIDIKGQRVAETGARIGHVGDIVGVTPFDDYGRRTFSMSSQVGQVDVIQGITAITPLWTRVEGLANKRPYVWDCRLATSSIPRDVLQKVLSRQIDPKNFEQRSRLVRLFLQGERFGDAQAEMEGILRDFPERQDLAPLARELKQRDARRSIEEIVLRRKVGQPQLARHLLENFPREDVAGETLQKVREMIADFDSLREQGLGLLKELEELVNEIPDTSLKQRARAVYEEIVDEISLNTADRMAAYLRLANDQKLTGEDKLALAASGWIVGSNEAITNLPVSLSMFEVRNLVRKYLSDPVKINREEALRQIKSQEAGTPRMVAQIVANMKPPLSDKTSAAENATGFYELSVPGFDKEPSVTYYVQTPPEYDPYRAYPTIVTLAGGGTTPVQQIEWWAGAANEDGQRMGQSMRFGYIVIAVDWRKEGQRQYEYSAREHSAVLSSLRDACRRFNVDTDRVYLSGHSIGGDAAWDLGQSHPDLWAGVIPIVATADKYSAHYWPNVALVPFYFIAGELDGDKTLKNSREFDRYLKSQSPLYDVTVVEYLGRGHEHFHDEILRLFDWMGRKERNFFPRSFKVVSMRPFDNYFWWLEMSGMPSKAMVDPGDFPIKRAFTPVQLRASVKGNVISISTGADRVAVWLSPDLVDFQQKVRITVDGKLLRTPGGAVPGPDLVTLLEDVRTRGERRRPFWLKIE
jgi:predicted esterase